ncbi:hypothetical protein MycrhDRAFT_1681 [Mycolicibacterium rhodesiae JS60]|nr:hypothetical protein MycrhDRAFT_1681 [Mycolicibacterium rhodesiae JS60]
MTPGMTLAFGTYADAKRMEGFEQEARHAEVPVSQAMIAFFCSLIEDGNASYWDSDFAERTWGSLVAPPAMVNVWMMPLPWRPQGADLRPSIALRVPLPGSVLINVGIDVEYERHVHVGDRLHSIERVDHVGPEKRTRLGVGHFIDSSARYYNQDGELVATYKNTLFRYEPHPSVSG